jgi:hypothetical protein
MTFVFHCHLAVTCALVGLIWTVQIVVYPLFDRVGRAVFASWHQAYVERIGRVVGPLMLMEMGTAGWLLWAGWRDPVFVSSVALLGFIWVTTALVQVPLHRRLAGGFEGAAHQRLVRTNWLRTLAWSLRGLLLFLLP